MPGFSAGVWLVLPEGAGANAAPDAFDPVDSISWLRGETSDDHSVNKFSCNSHTGEVLLFGHDIRYGPIVV